MGQPAAAQEIDQLVRLECPQCDVWATDQLNAPDVAPEMLQITSAGTSCSTRATIAIANLSLNDLEKARAGSRTPTPTGDDW